jgi:cytochrome d ubiquinol oxidase subunit I
MMQSTLWLALLQFFSSTGFVLLFLVLQVGLAWLLVYFRIRSLRTQPLVWLAAYRFWVRIFALALILAFSSSVVALIQLGSLWPGLSDRAGNVAGPLVGAALLTAFIFKSCFLGAMLYGQRRFSAWVHTLMVVLVALGGTLASLWIVALVSWTHTPAGAGFIEGHYAVYQWAQVIFNPAFPWYAGFFLLACLLTAAFLIMGVVAWQALHHPSEPHQRLAFGVAVRTAAVSVLVLGALVLGSARMFIDYQPVRAAATAAHWHSGDSPDLLLFGWPDSSTGSTRWPLKMPGASSPFLKADPQGNYVGLDQFAGMMPPVALVFWAFRVAVIAGVAMAFLALLTWWRARRLDDPVALGRGWLRALVAASFAGWVLAGAGFVYLFAGAFPFAITGTVTFSELATAAAFGPQFSATIAYAVIYVLMMLGFLHMLWHNARYGVVPVVRVRGRA